jgi:hypothetical protein
MDRPLLLFTTQALVMGVTLAWPATGSASASFPSVVESALNLTTITVDPPLGCKLCHTSDSGGLGTLSRFGTLMKQYGAMPGANQSVVQALMLVEQSDKALIDDIKAGRDPNADESAAPSLPSPQYGCSTTVGRSTRGESAWTVAVMLALVALARATRRANLKR